jgi:hypothetical protein|tara:strand:- start:2800 stop:3282 length:483 start_codon:yes stop_codon:yes gene_type:complete
MVKNLTILFFICFIGCEINSEQLIKNERVNFENIKFNAVSKDLNFNNSEVGDEVDYTKKLISNWFNNNIKIDGIEGNLNVSVDSIKIVKKRKNEYYRFEINLNIKFTEKNQTLNKTKSYIVNSIEYGDIQGNFSIKDIETLNENIILKSLKSINQKIINM